MTGMRSIGMIDNLVLLVSGVWLAASAAFKLARSGGKRGYRRRPPTQSRTSARRSQR